MSYSLQTHNVLEKALHLIPENALLGGDDIVPGILEIVQEDSGFVDILKKPRLMKTNPCFINKLTVDFQPSVNEFEENLLHDLNMDRLHRDNISPDDGLKISIVERRLRVCVHNGWTFVSEPHMVYLEPEFEVGGSKSGRKSPITPQTSLTGSKIASLVLRSRLELRELVRHPLFAVVFEVEYVISEPYAQPLINPKKKKVTLNHAIVHNSRGRSGVWFINPKKKKASLSGSLLRSQNQTITVRWAVWTPFGDIHPDDRDAYLTLECGGIHPGARMVYHGFNKKPGSIYLSFTHQKRRGSSVPSNSTRGSQLLPDLTTPAQMPQTGLGQMSSHSSLGGVMEDQDQSAGLRPGIASRPPLPGKSRTIGEYPPVGPGQGRPEAPAPVTSLTEVPHSSLHTPLLLSSTVGSSSRGSTLTRADYARLSRAGYPPITDRHGNPPLVIDPAEYVPLNLDNENMDSLQANEIVLHFLALNRCYGHRSVFFTFQFYRFPQVTTERLFLKNSDNQSQGDLCVLQKFNKDGSLSNEAPGLLLKYLVDPAFMQRGENRVFCRYLLSQTIHMDVWDGDSLLLIGSLAIELKHLLRQGREAVLVSHEVDIVSVEFSEDAPAMPGDVTRTGTVRPVGMRAGVEGALHIRMANIGHHSEMNTDMIGTVPKKHSHVIMSETIRGTLSGTAAAGVTMRSKAKPVAECDGELAAVLFSRQNKINKNDKPVSQNDAIRKRKLERMQAVRQIKGTDSKVDNLVQPNEPQDVFLKVACGPSPSVKRFFLLLFIDPFMATPCQTWQFYVHSLQRVDISAVEGQTSQLSVILRGTQSSRLVQCFTSHAEELQVRPSDPFMLMANGVHEISLSLTPLTSGGTRYMYVNVVDNEFHQLVRTWLVCATCQQPVISKAFELQLQVGGGKGSNKRVTFTNPYPTRKAFHLKSNRPDLLQFKEDTIEVGPGASHNIGLRFSPQPAPAVTQILIFINDSEGKNEETFSITAVYK
ncbi:predicted protein [Nematostella vectensis]|uniref:Nephrocystin-4 n=1 Tax=Nematostella vectensis TaxID=45351 RepID=A7S371_NEMVE|nr:predicted protein [Nematostella vectensis]|eukprot:XP_001633863.1 predicted protein [Nematostella vectensis]